MEAAVEALLAFGEARARVSGGAARFPGSSGPSGAGAGGRDQILSDELLAMQLQEELLREGELPRPPDLSEALGGLWGSVSAAATDLGNLAVTTGRAVAEGVSSVAVNLLSEEGGGGGQVLALEPALAPVGAVVRRGIEAKRTVRRCSSRSGSGPLSARGCTAERVLITRRTIEWRLALALNGAP